MCLHSVVITKEIIGLHNTEWIQDMTMASFLRMVDKQDYWKSLIPALFRDASIDLDQGIQSSSN